MTTEWGEWEDCGDFVLQNLIADLCFPGHEILLFPNHKKQFKQAKEAHIFERADLLARMGISRDAKYHVLAVDDSLLDRKIIERILKASSCQVTLVDSGNKALELLGLQDDKRGSQNSSQQEIGVNLIITDYCMPGMTGYDLLKRIKESAYLKDIPVVVMSSENVPSRINRCLEEGAEEFLLKPVKLSDMKKLRPHLLKGKSSSQEHEPNAQNPPQEGLNLIQQQQQPQSQSLPKAGKSNKRKVMEGGRISPERTRASYKDYGLTAMV